MCIFIITEINVSLWFVQRYYLRNILINLIICSYLLIKLKWNLYTSTYSTYRDNQIFLCHLCCLPSICHCWRLTHWPFLLAYGGAEIRNSSAVIRMDRFPLEHRKFLYDCFVKFMSARKHQRKFWSFPNIRAPHRNTIQYLVKKFQTTGVLTHKPSTYSINWRNS
jgi:hypothetical protein